MVVEIDLFLDRVSLASNQGRSRMADLVFDGSQHKLTYYSKDGTPIGDGWYANNVVVRSVRNLRFLPNREYHFLDKHSPHRHGNAVDRHGVLRDSVNGSFGRYGILRLQPFTHHGVPHSGVGVHSGRATWEEPTTQRRVVSARRTT